MADTEDAPGGKPTRDYAVGRGKPPKHTQFPYQKSNRAGKKKGTKDWATLANEELDQLLEIEEAGKIVSVDKRRLIVKGLVNKAARGDWKALELLVRFVPARAVEEADDLQDFTAEMIANFLKRFSKAGEDSDA